MLSRRSFLTALPILALPGCSSSNGGPETGAPALDIEPLRALAEVLLPAELGRDGIDTAVSGFAQWIADYRPAVERDHAYGSGDIDYTAPHPGPGWAAQLDALDAESRQRHGLSFTGLDLERRAALVRAALQREGASDFPPPADAHSVALGVVAWFFASPAANDLCYAATIQRGSCRPLATVSARPASGG